MWLNPALRIAPKRNASKPITTWADLPDNMSFELVEPLRYLFKDEVRLVGQALGLPSEMVWRQPFPGPGLAVRCLGEVTAERLQRLRLADAILTSELAAAGLLRMSATARQRFPARNSHFPAPRRLSPSCCRSRRSA